MSDWPGSDPFLGFSGESFGWLSGFPTEQSGCQEPASQGFNPNVFLNYGISPTIVQVQGPTTTSVLSSQPVEQPASTDGAITRSHGFTDQISASSEVQANKVPEPHAETEATKPKRAVSPSRRFHPPKGPRKQHRTGFRQLPGANGVVKKGRPSKSAYKQAGVNIDVYRWKGVTLTGPVKSEEEITSGLKVVRQAKQPTRKAGRKLNKESSSEATPQVLMNTNDAATGHPDLGLFAPANTPVIGFPCSEPNLNLERASFDATLSLWNSLVENQTQAQADVLSNLCQPLGPGNAYENLQAQALPQTTAFQLMDFEQSTSQIRPSEQSYGAQSLIDQPMFDYGFPQLNNESLQPESGMLEMDLSGLGSAMVGPSEWDLSSTIPAPLYGSNNSLGISDMQCDQGELFTQQYPPAQTNVNDPYYQLLQQQPSFLASGLIPDEPLLMDSTYILQYM